MRTYTKEQLEEAERIINCGGSVDLDLAIATMKHVERKRIRKKKLNLAMLMLGLWLGFLLAAVKWGGLWEAICGK